MYIWFHPNITLTQINAFNKDTMAEHLGLEFTAIGDDYLCARLPVDHRTHQPYGILHGGASVALAETIGSIASALVIDNSRFICVGLEINANHIRSVRSGFVTGTCKPIHTGRSTHVWDIRITDEAEKLVCVSRLTVAILDKS